MLHRTFRSFTSGPWILAAGFAAGLLWFGAFLSRSLGQPIAHDAYGYRSMAQIFAGARSLTDFPSEWTEVWFRVRLVGYPLFLAPLAGLTDSDSWFRIGVAAAQLLLYFAAVTFLSIALRRFLSTPRANAIGFVLLALPYPYVLAVEVLADSLTLTLAVGVFAAIALLLSGSRLRLRVAWFFLAAGLSALALIIRTDAWPVLIAVAVAGTPVFAEAIISARSRAQRLGSYVIGAAASTFLALLVSAAMRPVQFVTTSRFGMDGNWTPEGGGYVPFGVRYLKYATGIGPPPVDGAIFYENPFFADGQQAGLLWYLLNPLEAALYVPLRLFALVDWDWPFAYVETVPAGPYPVLFILTQLVVFNGCVALVVLTRHVGQRRGFSSAERWLGIAVLASVASYLALRIPTHVELRYGLAAIAGLAALATWWLTRPRANYRRVLFLQAIAVVVWLPLAWLLASWIQSFVVLSA